MERNIYETYEFLPTNSAEVEADQFFVLQNDGTLLINREVQYVAQVQDVKGVLENGQPCPTVYDVSSQQYYVDVDNSTELISVTDQFALPQDGPNSDFGNNYLLQSIPAVPVSTVQMAETGAVDEHKEFNFKMDKKQTNPSTIQGLETTNFTEVTLNHEQYRTLEIKGWVLLESGGKVYLLNTLGLHDITDNTKLIEDLRNDVEVIEPSILNECTKNSTISYGFEEIVTEPIQPKQETKQLCLADTVAVIQNSYEKSLSTESLQESQESLESGNVAPVTSNQVETPTDTRNNEIMKPSMIVRLKINVAVEDIPNKIVLGKTVNGKNLVAKVMSIKRPATNVNGYSKDNPKEPDDMRRNVPVVSKTVVKQNKEAYYKAKEVESLMQKYISSPTELTTSAEDVKSAEVIIKQLLNVPATRSPMVERNLIITKIVQTMKDADHLESETGPTLVTGRVAQFDEKGDWHFIYIPQLFQKLQKDVSSNESEMSTCGASSRLLANKTRDDYLLHVHVLEIKCPNVPTKTSITFSKKPIPDQITFNGPLTNKAIYACSACAKMFTNEPDLNKHRATECMEVEDEKPPLIIDTDKMSKPSIGILKSTVITAKNSSPCPYCNTKVKLSNYKRHLQSHKLTSSPKDNENGQAKPTAYKCKMCSTTYYHASTLTKHILSHHIQSNISLFC